MRNTAGPVPATEARAGRSADRRSDRRGWTAARWGGVAELRADLPTALRLTAVLLLAGIPAGLLWWLLAPVVHYVQVEGQTVAVEPSVTERAPAGDVIFTLIMVGLGLVAGGVGWLLRRRRGVTVLAAVAVGTGLAGVLAWQLGERLVSWFGGSVDTRVGPAHARLELASHPALAVGPFFAVLVYVVATLLAPGDDLGRTAGGAGEPGAPAEARPPVEARSLGG